MICFEGVRAAFRRVSSHESIDSLAPCRRPLHQICYVSFEFAVTDIFSWFILLDTLFTQHQQMTPRTIPYSLPCRGAPWFCACTSPPTTVEPRSWRWPVVPRRTRGWIIRWRSLGTVPSNQISSGKIRGCSWAWPSRKSCSTFKCNPPQYSKFLIPICEIFNQTTIPTRAHPHHPPNDLIIIIITQRHHHHRWTTHLPTTTPSCKRRLFRKKQHRGKWMYRRFRWNSVN